MVGPRGVLQRAAVLHHEVCECFSEETNPSRCCMLLYILKAMGASEFSLLQERVRHVVPTAGAVTCGKPTRHAATSHWRMTRLEVEVGVTCRTVVIRLFRLHVLYLELACPLFILRTLPLCPSVFTDKILPHASTLPFFANDGAISLASLCGILGGRSDSRICFCASIAVFPCQYGSNIAPCAYSFVCR